MLWLWTQSNKPSTAYCFSSNKEFRSENLIQLITIQSLFGTFREILKINLSSVDNA